MDLASLLMALPRYRLLPSTVVSTTASGMVAGGGGPPLPKITNITSDSRQVELGSLFVAYRGVNVDGRRFIPEVIARGATAVVCESDGDALKQWEQVEHRGEASTQPIYIIVPDGREALAFLSAAWHGFPARRLTMVGVTGTDGKTTTTNLLYHLLRSGARQKVGMITTVNAVIGDETLDTGLHTTTPDSPDVQRYLAQMVKAGTEVCLLEVTSHGLAHHRVSACDFDAAIVTNITHEHLDLHGSLEAYRAAKARLFEGLATAVQKGVAKMAVLNCDDISFEYLKQRVTAVEVAWSGYSLAGHPEAAVTAQDIFCGPDKTRFTIRWGPHTFDVETVLAGDHNVSNCLAAATAALVLFGLSIPEVQAGMTALPGIPGRMERINEGQSFMAMVDFAHTPNALRRTLATVRALTPGRVIAVFGCAGLRDVEKRTLMGQIAAELADVTIVTAEDPRTESLTAIMAETAQAMVAAGAVEGQTFERQPDRGRAIYRATQLAQPGDTVIALGKGHEQSMCFGRIEYTWDDREAMRSALRGKPLLTLPTANRSA